MSTLIICLFIACLLPILSKIPAVIAMKNQPGGYDNHYPRLQQSALTGFGARAAAAHQNSFESLIIFATATLAALATQHTGQNIQYLAISYLVVRVLYHVLYLLDLASLRSLIWTVSLIIPLSMLIACID